MPFPHDLTANAYQGHESHRRNRPEGTITLKHPGNPGDLVRYDLVLPSFSNPILTRFEIEEESKLKLAKPDDQMNLVVLGDSISHGTGQGSATYKAYPYQLFEKLDLELINLAVGAGRVSLPIADLLKHLDKVDFIWILVGYNGTGKTVAEFRKD